MSGRHGMGYVHFVRSPYAHAKILSIDVAAALELEGVYGTLTGDEVAICTDPFFELDAAGHRQGLRARGRQGAARASRWRPSWPQRRGSSRATPPTWSRSSTTRSPSSSTASGSRWTTAPILHEEAARTSSGPGLFEWGDFDAALAEADHVVRIERAALRPLLLDAARVQRARSSSTSGDRPVDDLLQPPDARGRCDLDGAGAAGRHRQAPLRHAGHRRRLRQQDLPAPPARWPAACSRASSGRPVQWTEWRTDQHMANSHGNERTFLDVEVPVKADGTLLGFKVRAIDDCGAFPRYEPLGCMIWAQVTPGLYRWRNIRVDFTQVCTNKAPVVAEPRLLADAAPLADRADRRHRRARARPRPGRGAEAQLHPHRRDAVHDAERLRLRLRRLRTLPRHRARADRLRGARRGGAATRRRAASCSASGSARRSTRGRTTSASRRSSTRSCSSRATTRWRRSSSTSSARSSSRSAPSRRARATRRPRRRSSPTSSAARPTTSTCGPGTTRTGTRTRASPGPTRASSPSPGLGAVKGAAELLAAQMNRLAAVVLGAAAGGHRARGVASKRIKDNPEAALPFMASARSSTRTTPASRPSSTTSR